MLFDDKFETFTCTNHTETWTIWDALAEPLRQNPKPAIDMVFTSFNSLPNKDTPMKPSLLPPAPQRETKVMSSEGDKQPAQPADNAEKIQESDPIDLRTLIKTVRFKPTPKQSVNTKSCKKKQKSLPRHKVHAKAKCKYNTRQYVPNPSNPTQATGKRVSLRAKKQSFCARNATRDNAIKAMLSIYDHLNKKDPKLHTLPLNEQIDRMLDLTALDKGEFNDLNPWALAALANPNILSHSEAKHADDWDEFVKAMKEEVDRMLENNIFKLVKRSVVPLNQRILRSVWSHRRKTTPSGEVYRHRSRLCVDGSQQQEGIDYNEPTLQ